ncbi:MAG: hypothetical protein JXB14_00370 [Candidatus Altiarchaeota archaeon]|nr:hypothetical protein [Candidatus Altiarchaeota archaeon]
MILGLIDKSITAVKGRDALELRRISSEAINEAAIEQHRELILLGLIDYALSKILSKTHYEKVPEGFYEEIQKYLESAKTGGDENVLLNLEKIEDMVIKLDESEGRYEDNLMEKARVKKAAKLYYSGLSLKRAAGLTGANPSDVLAFVGQSRIHEFRDEGPLSNRIKIAREVFE